jgi:DNA primase
MPRGQDPDTLLREHGPEAVRKAVTQGVEPIDFLLAQIEARHPLESQEFWEQATGALANLTSQLEVERHLMPLAGRYPFMRDPVRAAQTLRLMVRKAARARSQPDERRSTAAERPRSAVVLPTSLEAEPFRALADPDTRDQAWGICLREDLYVTEAGVRLSKIARQLKDSGVEFDGATELLEAIEEEGDRDLYASVLLMEGASVDSEKLADVEQRLSHGDHIRVKTRIGTGATDDEALRGLTARLKLLKGEKPLEKSPDEGLDTQPDPFV